VVDYIDDLVFWSWRFFFTKNCNTFFWCHLFFMRNAYFVRVPCHSFLAFFWWSMMQSSNNFFVARFFNFRMKKKIFLANRNFLFEWRIQIIEPNFFFSTLPGFLCLHFFKKDLRNLHSFSGLVQI